MEVVIIVVNLGLVVGLFLYTFKLFAPNFAGRIFNSLSMSSFSSTNTLSTTNPFTMPPMSSRATFSASSGVAANFIPPALNRPVDQTFAFMTTGFPYLLGHFLSTIRAFYTAPSRNRNTNLPKHFFTLVFIKSCHIHPLFTIEHLAS